jgi:glycosyltransferase involved in cell wall biosynthesis
MHILHVLGGLANASGPTHIVYSQARHLAARGCEVTIFHLTGRNRDTVPFTCPNVTVRGFPAAVLKGWGWSPALRKALDHIMPSVDLVHVHSLWLYLNIAAVRAAHRHGVPVMIAPQGALDDWSLALHRRRKWVYAALIERRLLNRADRIQAVSAHEIENVRAFGVTTPCAVVPNGIDPEAFGALTGGGALRARLGIPAGVPVILFLSRVHPKKGLDILLDAFATVSARHPDARLLVAGGDAGSGYADTIRAQVQALGLENRVVFAGEVGGEHKCAVFDAADCFALSSHSEGLPVAALEALAAGLPVVISEACNIPDVAAAGAGRVVTLSRETVSTALLELLADPGLRAEAARRASRLARERFSWDAVCEKLLAVYQTMRTERPARSGSFTI